MHCALQNGHGEMTYRDHIMGLVGGGGGVNELALRYNFSSWQSTPFLNSLSLSPGIVLGNNRLNQDKIYGQNLENMADSDLPQKLLPNAAIFQF